MPTVLAAPDKFRGTLEAAEVAAAVVRAAHAMGWAARAMPVADGGEGTLEALGGRPQFTTVTGPLGDPVRAEWRLIREGGETRAVVEMARASGLALVGGPEGNDPLAATTYGTGELIAAAIDAGATEVLVGAGGSATTDGGLGAIRALEPYRHLRNVELVVACDVAITFVEAAAVFAPQKGATPAQVALLTRRLERLAQLYERWFGIDVRTIPGGGAAGGLAGGLAALGARLEPGFTVVAQALDLASAVSAADLVVTGEGALDEQSFNGKAVGGVVALAEAANVPVLVVAGEVGPDACPPGRHLTVASLTERFGPHRARTETAACIEAIVREHLSQLAENRRLGP